MARQFNRLIPLVMALLAAAGSSGLPARAADFPADPLGWPASTSVNRPWTRWWWFGSAVDRPNLTRQLEDFAMAGLGGVEICPVYGAVGAEDRALPFLSPKWLAMLGHTTTEARRLGLGVDMTTGTGWPFGGPQVTPEIASSSLQLIRKEATGGQQVRLTLSKGTLQCLRAFPESGPTVDLTALVKEGELAWLPPAGNWQIVGLSARAPIQQVKRAAPGGEGNVLDPFSAAAMKRYLAAFDRAFENFTAPRPRAQFHDSFEYYGADWTPAMLADFQAARGYDLREQLPAFAGLGDPDTVARVRADYRETLSEAHHAYLRSWHDWAKAHGGITRNQGHGSPGNLLDHYAVSEIPETEIFRHVDENQMPMMHIAASAAHANGTNLVSAESFTWLDEHFKVTPEKLKEAADFVFLGGVNHIFFHGIPYSPADAPWPGWLFYASTHLGQNGGLWHDLAAFTGYLQRCQSILQDGQPSSDVLIYYPVHDLWHNSMDKLPLFSVHNQESWLWPTPFYRTSMELWNHGVSFDYASGNLLARASVKDGQWILGGHAYRALVLAGVQRMPPEILAHLHQLSAQGATVIVQDGWPTEAPGFHRRQQRGAELLAIEAQFTAPATARLITGSILPALAGIGCFQEHMTDAGLRFVRRSHPDGYHYFIVNRSAKTFDGILPLAVPFHSAVIMDPWNPATNGIATPQRAGRETGVALRLEPGQSIIIRTFTTRDVPGQRWARPPPNPQSLALSGPWKIQFIEGGPVLPAAADVRELASWTTLPDPAAVCFAGTARYSTSFELAAPAPAACMLDLGRVANTARVAVNGQPFGISWCAPHVVDVTRALRPGANRLDIEVTNLAANRIADLDRRQVPWKRFHEINFVNSDYKLFDASGWPALDSGLIGPVTLRIPSK